MKPSLAMMRMMVMLFMMSNKTKEMRMMLTHKASSGGVS